MFLCNGGKGYRGEFVYIRDDREAGVGVEYFSLCEVRVFGPQGGSASTCPVPSNVLFSAANRSIGSTTVCTITEKALRHYAKQGLIPW